MKGKNVVLTGGNSGIGLEAAVAIASAGASVWIAARDERKGNDAVASIRSRSGNPEVRLLVADLSSQAEVHGLADRILAEVPRLDVLVNNAGLTLGERRLTVDGLETTFAVNHLGYFLLTGRLIGRLRESAPARIVNVASRAHTRTSMRWDDLQGENGYDGWRAYCQSKLANVLFTKELAKRLEGTGVTANCLHPGVVATNFGNRGPFLVRAALGLVRPLLTSPADGARTTTYLVTSPDVEGVSGAYFSSCTVETPSADAQDADSARRLWEISERLTGFTWPA